MYQNNNDAQMHLEDMLSLSVTWCIHFYHILNFAINIEKNKAGFTATPVACRWAVAIFEGTWSFGQEQWGQRQQKLKKSKVWWTDRLADQRNNGYLHMFFFSAIEEKYFCHALTFSFSMPSYISRGPCQWAKLKFAALCSKFSLIIWAIFGSF